MLYFAQTKDEYTNMKFHLKSKMLIIFRKILSVFIAFVFLLSTSITHAQIIQPSATVSVTSAFTPTMLAGLTIDPNNPLRFDFLISDGEDIKEERASQDEAKKLVRYFLSALTIPEKDLWVNLSPYEPERLIPEDVGKTELGHELLAQDYLLKQLSASLTHPETEVGKIFWGKVYYSPKGQNTTALAVDE